MFRLDQKVRIKNMSIDAFQDSGEGLYFNPQMAFFAGKEYLICEIYKELRQVCLCDCKTKKRLDMWVFSINWLDATEQIKIKLNDLI